MTMGSGYNLTDYLKKFQKTYKPGATEAKRQAGYKAAATAGGVGKTYTPPTTTTRKTFGASTGGVPQYDYNVPIGWQSPGVGLGAGAQYGPTQPTGQQYTPTIPEGQPYGLGEAGGLKFPWETPKGVGFIAPWTEQAEVGAINPITGQPYSAGYIQTGGATEQVAAGAEFLAGVEEQWQERQPVSIPEGWFSSPYDIPPELAQNPNYEINYDPKMMAWRVDPVTLEAGGVSALDEEYTRLRMELERRAQELEEQKVRWEQEQAGQLSHWQQEQLNLAYRELEQEEDRTMSEYERAMIGLQQQRQSFSEQQAAAQLAAQPSGWLQSAALTGETPVVQSWMLPLMPQEYQSLQVGEPIPGWSQADMSGMPQLLNPSAQYWARLTPAQRDMYLAYIQALTGQLPEDVQFRMWSAAPSGGGGLTYAR